MTNNFNFLQGVFIENVDLLEQHEDGLTPIMICFFNNHKLGFDFKKIDYMLRNSDLKARDSEGWDVLMYALRYNNSNGLRLTNEQWDLLIKNSDLKATQRNGWSSLMFALKYSWDEKVNLSKEQWDFLIKNSDLSLKNDDSVSPLMFALDNYASGYLKLEEEQWDFLIKSSNLKEFKNGESLLSFYAENNSSNKYAMDDGFLLPNYIFELIFKNVILTEEKIKGVSPLLYFLKNNKNKKFNLTESQWDYLIKNSNVNAVGYDGKNALMLFLEESKNQEINLNEESINYLIENTKLSTQDNSGKNSLMYAFKYLTNQSSVTQNQIVKMLEGSDLNQKDNLNNTALFYYLMREGLSVEDNKKNFVSKFVNQEQKIYLNTSNLNFLLSETNLNLINKNGETVLSYIFKKNKTDNLDIEKNVIMSCLQNSNLKQKNYLFLALKNSLKQELRLGDSEWNFLIENSDINSQENGENIIDLLLDDNCLMVDIGEKNINLLINKIDKTMVNEQGINILQVITKKSILAEKLTDETISSLITNSNLNTNIDILLDLIKSGFVNRINKETLVELLDKRSSLEIVDAVLLILSVNDNNLIKPDIFNVFLEKTNFKQRDGSGETILSTIIKEDLFYNLDDKTFFEFIKKSDLHYGNGESILDEFLKKGLSNKKEMLKFLILNSNLKESNAINLILSENIYSNLDKEDLGYLLVNSDLNKTVLKEIINHIITTNNNQEIILNSNTWKFLINQTDLNQIDDSNFILSDRNDWGASNNFSIKNLFSLIKGDNIYADTIFKNFSPKIFNFINKINFINILLSDNDLLIFTLKNLNKETDLELDSKEIKYILKECVKNNLDLPEDIVCDLLKGKEFLLEDVSLKHKNNIKLISICLEKDIENFKYVGKDIVEYLGLTKDNALSSLKEIEESNKKGFLGFFRKNNTNDIQEKIDLIVKSSQDRKINFESVNNVFSQAQSFLKNDEAVLINNLHNKLKKMQKLGLENLDDYDNSDLKKVIEKNVFVLIDNYEKLSEQDRIKENDDLNTPKDIFLNAISKVNFKIDGLLIKIDDKIQSKLAQEAAVISFENMKSEINKEFENNKIKLK